MAYTSRERPYRSRGRPQAAPKNDAATTALTAQVILCALMFLSMLLIKKFDEPRYDAFKAEYPPMVSKSSSGLFSGLESSEGVLSGLWEKAGEALGGIFSAKPAPQSGAEEQLEDYGLDEPGDGEETTGLSEDSSTATYALEYDYLGSKSVSYVNSGGGGLSVANLNTGEMLPAPAGCVLSPVYLGAKIKPPVTGLITSGFNYRYHPVSGKNDFHTGMDIAAEEGSPILAALPGEVIEVGNNDIYGNYIVLKHATNLQTSYSHCSEIIAKTGMSVRQGERIALVGQTGTATGPHLHFSVIVEDEFTDPAWVLRDYIKLVE